MSADQLILAEEIVASWRSGAGMDNPAGPLYAGGAHVESDIVRGQLAETRLPTACTSSFTHACC